MPDAGKIWNTSGFAKVINNKVANQNEGMEYNMNNTMDEPLSNLEPLLAAAFTPKGILTK